MRTNFAVLSFLAVAALAGAGRADPVATSGVPASAYVRNGLVAQWDGIENAGRGLHDDAPASWTELVNGVKVTHSGALTYNPSNVYFNGSAYFKANVPAVRTALAAKSMTAELFLRPAKYLAYAGYLHVGSSGSNRELVLDMRAESGSLSAQGAFSGLQYATDGWYDTAHCCIPMDTKSYIGKDTLATIRVDSDGAKIAFDAGSNVHTNCGKGATISSDLVSIGWYYDSGKATFNLYSSRFYDRALADAEVAWNNMIDRHRFLGEPLDDAVSCDSRRVSDGAVQQAASVSCNDSALGTVSLTDGTTTVGKDEILWLSLGVERTFTYRAVAAAGCVFCRWEGDTTGLTTVQVYAPTLSFTSDGARMLTAVFRQPTTRYWRGTTSSSAAVAANWSDATLPQAGDAIVLDGVDDNAQRALTWDLDDVTPGSWTQDGYTNVVTFMTGTPGVTYWNQTPAVHGVLMSDNTREFHVFGDVTVNSGTWTVPMHPQNNSITPASARTQGTGTYRLTVKVGGDLTVGANARVYLNLRGLYQAGPGMSTSANSSSHGGMAGSCWGYGYPYCYGSVYRPKTLGSGGYGSWGGGAAWLQATGKVTVDGKVSADSGTETYAGSAGSVLIVGDSIEGSGTVSASAPHAWQSGGAGRVAFIQTGAARDFKKWTGTAEAMAGTKPSDGTVDGSPGTVYFETADKPYAGDLLIRGKGGRYYVPSWDFSYYDRPESAQYRVRSTMLSGILADGQDYTFDTVTIDGYGCLGVGTNCTLRFNTLNCVGQAVNMLALYGGTVVLPETTTLTNMSLRSVNSGSTIKFADGVADRTLTIGKSCTFVVDALTHIEGNLVVTNGGCITHTLARSTTGYRVNLDVSNDLVVATGGTIGGDGLGYTETSSDARGYSSVADRGGSHGGLNRNCGTATCYGSIRKPVTPGAPGKSNGGFGGGVVTLNVGGDLKVDGSMRCNGNMWSYYATGAGGSIWVKAKTISGSGTIQANGGYTYPGYSVSQGYYAAAGGRVAVWLTQPGADFSNFPLERIQAYAGAKPGTGQNSSQATCAAGTVYLKKGDEAENGGTLYLANRGTLLDIDATTALISSAVTDTDVGSVVVTNFGYLTIEPGCSLTVSRDFHTVTNGAFKSELSDDAEVENGTVEFVDATQTSRITGLNSFANLTCVAAGKTLRFGTDRNTDLARVNGILKLTGTEELPLYVKSLLDGTSWLLNVDGSSDVSYVTAWDSDASVGKTVVDVAGEIKDTVNWSVITPVVPGAVNTWTGADTAHPTDWTSANNWSQGRAPAETDQIVISHVDGSYPELSANTVCNSLEIKTGATLDLNSCDLTVTNVLTVAGTLGYDGGETIEFAGNQVDFTNGSISGPDGQLNLTVSGTGTLWANLWNLAWGQIRIVDRAGTVSWRTGFAADKLMCLATNDLAMTFAAGERVTLRELELDGSGAGESMFLTLASSSSGTAWLLKVTQFASVTGAKIGDSNASESAMLLCDDQPSQDNGGNTNWRFTRSRVTWLGGSGNFNNAAKWSGGVVPDKDTMAILTSNSTVTTEGAAAPFVGELRILGAGNQIKGTNTVYVRETFYMNGGTLTMDAPLVVSNAAFLVNGSTITHTANTSVDTQELNLTVEGSLTVDATSKISAQGKGYARCGYYPGSRPDSCQIAHGGRGRDDKGLCYGSVFRPRTSGSSTDSYGVGGGRIWLNVRGTATINGRVTANGQSAGEGWTWRTACGGSVYLAAGALAGSGSITANGGIADSSSSGYGQSGGGRVAVYLTGSSDFASFTGAGGVISAYGTRQSASGSLPTASCGTVYLQGANGEKRIILDNDNGCSDANCKVDLPVSVDRGGDDPKLFRDVTLVIRHRGGVNLMDDLLVKEVEVETANTSKNTFFLNDHTLTIRKWTHKNGKGWAKCSRSAGTEGLGKIVWQPKPLGIIVR